MLSKGTEYAIRALVYIQLQNRVDRRPGVEEIGKEIDAPVAYSAKILQTLTKRGLLLSMKGRGGGFFFQDGATLTLYDVIVAMEGDLFFTKCGFGLKDCCHDNPCPLHDQYLSIRGGFYQIVKSETIQGLADKIQDGKAILKRLT